MRPNSPLTIRLGGVPEHFNAPWHLSQPALRQAGFDLQWTDFASGTGALTRAMERQELDAALVLTEGILAYLLSGGAARLAGTYVKSPLLWGIHVHASSPYERAEQLRGLRYAISRHGSGSHLMAFVSALSRGWPTDDLRFELVKNMEGARRSMAQDQSDVFMWEYFTTKPLVDAGEWRCVGTFSAPWPAFVLAVADHALDRVGPHLPALLESVRAFCPQDDVQDQEFLSYISSSYGQRPDDVLDWFGQTRWSCVPTVPEEALTYTASVLTRSGILSVDRPFDLDALCSPWCSRDEALAELLG